ncbi:MAG: dihydropteroate synthase [candidate division Zixibacteria bacterium RBG_16_40_9]|nr:MAG: dihydropteroate synthase [candidate division Zixibacteria bacterium RBG_16_40_9]
MNILTKTNQKEFTLNFRQKKYNLSERTHIMGVLNVTPDSFSDGGKFFGLEKAVIQGLKMVEEGADIIDIGAESTRPSSRPVSLEEEEKRALPVLEALAKKITVPISIDTYKSQIARKALEAGAEMINDISGLKFDPEMIKVASGSNVPVIIMHIKGTPQNMQENPYYENVIREIKDYFEERINAATSSGMAEENIILDPGIGFGKRFEDNLTILKNLKEFKKLAKPLLVGLSRKSFIGKILDLPVDERSEGSLGALALSIIQGANIVRVHDVKESVRVARVVDAILRG